MQPTQDHADIRRWAAKHNAKPAEISPFTFDSEPAVLRFFFGDLPANQPEIREISWENFFAQFDLMGLSLAHSGDSQYELVYVEKKDRREKIAS